MFLFVAAKFMAAGNELSAINHDVVLFQGFECQMFNGKR
jgi:hypothetical protein